MSKSNTITRLITSRPYAVGGFDSFQLSREYDIAAVIVEGVLVVNFNAAPTTISALAPAQAFGPIELKADGTRPLDQWDPRLLAWSNFERALMSDLTPPASATGNQNIRVGFQLDRITPDANRPKDSALHTKDYVSLLEINWIMGQPTDMCSVPGTATNAASTLTGVVNVYVEEIQEYDAGDAHEHRYVKRCSRLEAIVNAVNQSQLVLLSVNANSRGVKLLQLDTTLNKGEPTAALINNVKIRSGVDVRFTGSFAQLRQKNKRDFKINDALFNARTGLGYIDLLHNGDLKTLYSTVGKNEWLLELDVNAGPGKILIEHYEYAYQPAHVNWVNKLPKYQGGTLAA
jgi:hypothetical protein